MSKSELLVAVLESEFIFVCCIPFRTHVILVAPSVSTRSFL